MRHLALLGQAFLATLYILPTLASSQIPCATNSSIGTLEELVTCFQAYTVPSHYYGNPGDCSTESAKYAAAQPSDLDRETWSSYISGMLNIDGEKEQCSSALQKLRGLEVANYTVFRFDDIQGQSFCVLAESQTTSDNSMVYSVGWGLFVVPATKTGYARPIHISVPHPLFDGQELAVEAAALFKRSEAKSLTIYGRHRQAYPCPTNCSAARSGVYYKTDPTHESDEVFHSTLVAIADWQNNTECVVEPCGTFIQLHGKANDHCGNNNMFLSGGIQSPDWYTGHPSYPVNLLKDNLNAAFEGSPAISPVEDSSCDLTATRNVFARYLNGVPKDRVCSKSALKAQASGHFIHIEQHYSVILPEHYEAWAEALRATFPSILQATTRLEAEPQPKVYLVEQI